MKPGRNDPCICGSGKKYKYCCGGKVQPRPAAPSPAEFGQLVTLYNTGRYAELESRTRFLVEQYPGSGFAWKLLGVALMMQGKEALPAFQQTAKLLPDDAEAHFDLGVVLKKIGRLDDAVASYRRALKIKPDYAEALNNLGSAQQDLGLLDDAVASYRGALKLKPNYAEALNNLGTTLIDLGLLDEAVTSFRRALEIKPNYAEAYNNLGNTLFHLGQFDDAIATLRRSLEIKPLLAEAHNNLGKTLKVLGLLNDAAASFRRALEIKPLFAEAHNNLGIAQFDLGLPDDAVASFRRALEIKPDYAEAHNNLGVTLKSIGLYDEAIAGFRRALEINPDYAEAHSNLGVTLLKLGLPNDAIASLRRALEISPDYAEAHSNLGTALQDLGLLDDAIASLRRSLEIKPDFAIFNNMGNTLKDLGMLGDAEASYRQAIRLKPDFSEAHSNLLFCLNYRADHSPSDYLEEARLYGRMAARKVASRFTSWQCAAYPERLRVGMVSGDLRTHSVGHFLEGLLAQLDPARIDLIAYPTNPEFDQLSARIKSNFTAWKPLFGLNDQAAAQLIHADGVHVLIDLSGHTAHNRLPVFAWKPAPVQATWIGLPATTGLAEMDYVLGDPIAIPADDEGHFSEKVWRLPESYLCFTPPDAALDVGTLPALKAGFVTFGSFNNLTKMSDETVAVWARVLHAVPGSRLFLKTRQLKSPTVLEATLRRFDAHGIGSDRLILEAGSPQRADHLATYQRVDIALDPFPYRGVTTSVEALWMGVPVITLRGDRFLSRTAESIARNAGLADWVAAGEDDYVAKAVFHSENLERLAILRAGLRKQVLPSPLFDTARFARNVEDALWGMWQAHAQRT